MRLKVIIWSIASLAMHTILWSAWLWLEYEAVPYMAAAGWLKVAAFAIVGSGVSSLMSKCRLAADMLALRGSRFALAPLYAEWLPAILIGLMSAYMPIAVAVELWQQLAAPEVAAMIVASSYSLFQIVAAALTPSRLRSVCEGDDGIRLRYFAPVEED